MALERSEITIVRSRRKTISIAISGEGKIEVKAPFFMSEEELMEIVKSRFSWIQKAKEERKEYEAAKKQFITGDIFYFLGNPCKLQMQMDPERIRTTVSLKADVLYVFTNVMEREHLKDAIRKWYIHQAKMYLTKRVRFWGQYVDRPIGGIRIKEQKTRWGSCSTKGNLNFNWKIMMAPPKVVDYLVVHELCHLKFMNHGKDFWKEVEKLMPEYKNLKKWLKDNERFLDIETNSELK